VAFCLALGWGQPALAKSDNATPKKPESKIDHGLEEAIESGAPTVHVIITANGPARARIRKVLRQHRDIVKGDYKLVNALAAEIHTADLQILANDCDVTALSLDAPVSGGSTTLTSGGATGTLRQILGAPAASVATGRSIGVAIIDSGISQVTDFSGRITAFYDFTHGGAPVPAYDDYGHGTHIAGLIGSSGVSSNGLYTGVAPEVTFVGLKVLDGSGQGNTSDVINALQFVTLNRQQLNVQIVNLSLGHPILSAANDDPLVQAVEQASAAGLIVVVSAGNYGLNPATGLPGYAGITSPGNAPSSISVGATSTETTLTRDDDRVAPFSSRGPTWYDGIAKPDIVAPVPD
jgi:serine protease AprX